MNKIEDNIRGQIENKITYRKKEKNVLLIREIIFIFHVMWRTVGLFFVVLAGILATKLLTGDPSLLGLVILFLFLGASSEVVSHSVKKRYEELTNKAYRKYGPSFNWKEI